jgi:hypothetical protein
MMTTLTPAVRLTITCYVLALSMIACGNFNDWSFPEAPTPLPDGDRTATAVVVATATASVNATATAVHQPSNVARGKLVTDHAPVCGAFKGPYEYSAAIYRESMTAPIIQLTDGNSLTTGCITATLDGQRYLTVNLGSSYTVTAIHILGVAEQPANDGPQFQIPHGAVYFTDAANNLIAARAQSNGVPLPSDSLQWSYTFTLDQPQRLDTIKVHVTECSECRASAPLTINEIAVQGHP